MENYFISVNGENISISADEANTLDCIEDGTTNFHALENNKAYKVCAIQSDFLNRTFSISVNGNTYEVKIEDKYDQQVKKMGLLAVTSQKVNSIKAPMPGLIVDIIVEEGQEISEGTPLLVLSAMKMENILLSQGNGVVKSIKVKKDDAVEKGQLIIEME